MIIIKEINPKSNSFFRICDYLEKHITEENLSINGGTLNYKNLTYSSHILLLAFDNTIPIGYNSIVTDGNQYYIYQIAIKKEYQQRGIGTKLMERIIRIAEANNGFVTANVMDYNNNSKKMFLKLGFKKIGESEKGNGSYILYPIKKMKKSIDKIVL